MLPIWFPAEWSKPLFTLLPVVWPTLKTLFHG